MRRYLVGLTLMFMLALPLGAAAEDAAAVKKHVKANFDKMMAAFKKHDIKGVSAITADDYEGIAMGQKMNKEQMVAQMKEHMDSTKKINSTSYSISDFKVDGDKATGKILFNLDALVIDNQGMMGKKGKSHRLKMSEQSKVEWTKTGSDWLVSREESVGTPKMMVDGKPFNPGAPPQAKK